MKVEKIINEITKLFYKQQLFDVMIGKEDGYVYVGDKYHIYRIIEDDFILNVDKLIIDGARSYDFSKFFFERPAVINKGIILRLEDKNAVQLVGDGFNVYIDEKYLKHFQKPTFQGTGKNEPVIVLENDVAVGLILPINVKENWEMTKIVTLVLESENKEDIKQAINDIILDCSGYIKNVRIDEIKDIQLEVPKVFNKN